MKTYKAVMYFDLDGTLLNENSVLAEDTKVMIEDLMAEDVFVVIASGRAPFEIETMVASTSIECFISLNGQYAQYKGQSVISRAIDVTLIQALVQFASDQGHAVTFYGSQMNALTENNEVVERLYAFDHAAVPRIDGDFYLKNPVYMLYLFSDCPELDDRYRETFGDVLNFVRDTPYTLAITLKGISKRSGIRDLEALLGLERRTSYAFGDGMNDLEMFSAVDVSIAMGNAHPELKKVASMVSAHHLEGGIKKALKTLGFLGSK